MTDQFDFLWRKTSSGEFELTKYVGNGKHVVIPDGVTKICCDAFADSDVVSVEIPVSVRKIESGAFTDCACLESITIPSGVVKIEADTFSGCIALKNVKLHSGILAIGSKAFESCKSLEEINLPSGLTSIGDFAFSKCGSLKRISIPLGIKKIEHFAFYMCKSLSEVILNDDLESIELSAFEECYSLKSITIPDTVTSISRYAFESKYTYFDYIDDMYAVPKSNLSFEDHIRLEIHIRDLSVVPDILKRNAVLGFAMENPSIDTPRGEQIVEYLNGRYEEFKDMAMDYLPLLRLICKINKISNEMINDYIESALEHNLVEHVAMLTDTLISRNAQVDADMKLAADLGIKED